MEKIQQPTPSPPTRDERVGLLAFQIWEQEGRPEGQADEHWLLACTIIDGEAAGTTSEVLPTWLNRNAQDTTTQTKAEKPAVVQELNQKQQRRSAA